MPIAVVCCSRHAERERSISILPIAVVCCSRHAERERSISILPIAVVCCSRHAERERSISCILKEYNWQYDHGYILNYLQESRVLLDLLSFRSKLDSAEST
ncbi:MAG: hypothetical protein R3B45_03095 [Bdellovibrionota bacterium]